MAETKKTNAEQTVEKTPVFSYSITRFSDNTVSLEPVKLEAEGSIELNDQQIHDDILEVSKLVEEDRIRRIAYEAGVRATQDVLRELSKQQTEVEEE